MRNSTITLTTLFFAIGICSFSCQKESSHNSNETNGCSISMSSVAGTYKVTALTYKAASSEPEVDYLAFMDDCEKDDLTTLNPNGTYKYNDAGVKCSPDETGTGTWSLQGNKMISDGSIGGTISSFDCKKLVLYVENLNQTGDKLVFTMMKQ
jgi:Lipocalin-like domain